MENRLDSLLPGIQKLREKLHINPELSFKEYATTKLIEESIQSWGLKFNRFKDLETGGYCDIGEGDIIAFRSDIDALPIEEDWSNEIISQNKGIMHACGHDYHTAVGLGILKYFAQNKTELNKKVRIIFQPGEEAAPGGAEFVIKENVLENVKAALSVHVDPAMNIGDFSVTEGPVQASSTSIYIELHSTGGHTSKPDETDDLINISAYYVTQIQTLIKQKIDSRETVAFAFGKISGGSTHNIIPQKLVLRGTIRTHNNEVLSKCLDLMKSFTISFASLYGIKIDISFPTSCPATINDKVLADKFINFMQSTNRQNQLVLNCKPSMGADDFAFYGLYVPSLYLQVGANGKGSLHSKDLVLDDSLLEPTFEALVGFIADL